MENRVTKNDSVIAILTVLLFVFGGILLVVSLCLLPEYHPAYGFPWAFQSVVLSLIPLSAAGWFLNGLVRRRSDDTFRHGHGARGGAIVFALLVIIAGIILFCFNSGVLPLQWRGVFFSWQMLLLAIGAAELGRGRVVGGAILLGVGAFFIVRRLEAIYPDIAVDDLTEVFWPILLIFLGVFILGALIFRPRYGYGCGSDHGRTSWGNRSRASAASGYVDISAVFGSSEQVYLDPEFQGGKISTVFGGVTLDLRRTGLPEGDTYLQIESVFGGVELYIPDGWAVELRNSSVFGGFSDKRPPAVKKTYEDGRRLVIRSSSVFGGGEIK